MITNVDDMTHCSLRDLENRQYDCELTYRQRIMASAKGSDERAGLFTEAYAELVAILEEHRRRFGRPMDALGLSADTGGRLAQYLGPPPARLLDIGCGTGVLIDAMIERGYEAQGIDIAPRLIAIGRARMAAKPLTVECGGALVCGNFLHADSFGEAQFDLIHSNDVFEHLHPDEAGDFLRKAHGLLRPGGTLWLVTPNFWTGPGDATKLRHPPGTKSRGLHLKEYRLAELTFLLRDAGFDAVEARLWAGGRMRAATRFRAGFAAVKVALEPFLATLPPRWRQRIMGIMDYACVLARKAADPGNGMGGQTR